MNTDLYKQALFAARVERAGIVKQARELDTQRAELEDRLAKLDETISGLVLLSGETIDLELEDLKEDVQGLALPVAVRAALATSDRFMSAMRVRTLLRQIDYDFGAQKNPLASIHTILKRLVASGEAEVLDIEGKTGYRLRRDVIDAQ